MRSCVKIILFLCACSVSGDITMKEVIEQYSPEYCRLLEAAYGEGMMGECGVAYHLAREHDGQITSF